MNGRTPPIVIDPDQSYRVWFRTKKDGIEEEMKVIGRVVLVDEGEGHGWGVRVIQPPPDTTQYFPPGVWVRIAEVFDGPRGGPK